jgi:hypothetical protein
MLAVLTRLAFCFTTILVSPWAARETYTILRVRFKVAPPARFKVQRPIPTLNVEH